MKCEIHHRSRTEQGYSRDRASRINHTLRYPYARAAYMLHGLGVNFEYQTSRPGYGVHHGGSAEQRGKTPTFISQPPRLVTCPTEAHTTRTAAEGLQWLQEWTVRPGPAHAFVQPIGGSSTRRMRTTTSPAKRTKSTIFSSHLLGRHIRFRRCRPSNWYMLQTRCGPPRRAGGRRRTSTQIGTSCRQYLTGVENMLAEKTALECRGTSLMR